MIAKKADTDIAHINLKILWSSINGKLQQAIAILIKETIINLLSILFLR